MEQLTPDERIDAQEKAMEAVNCELALLRQHMDAQFASMRDIFEMQSTNMRQYVDDGLVKLKLEMQLYTKEEVDKVSARIERLSRWSTGLLVSILIGELAMLARGLLA